VLTPEEGLKEKELRLLQIVRSECRRTGSAQSLFQVGVILADLDYKIAHQALGILEERELVTVERHGRGVALIMREVVR
jgi:predicted component of type VI protein secretion system